MPELAEVVEYLDRNGELALGESPWATWTDEDEIYPLDWDEFFGDVRGDSIARSPVYVEEEHLDRLRNVIGQTPPQSDERSKGTLFDAEDAPKSASVDGTPGTKVCAWYQSIHFFGPEFGIFIRLDCAVRVMFDIASFLPAGTPVTPTLGLQLLRAAVFSFFLHEQYHHKVESLCLRLHVAARQPRYRTYLKSVYGSCRGKDDQLEEALAGAESYLRLGEPHYSRKIGPVVRQALQNYLRRRFPLDPPGYRMAECYLSRAAFDAGENLLQGRISEARMTPGQPSTDWRMAPHLTQSFFRVTSHVWWVVERGGSVRIPGTTLPVRTCSTRDMLKMCEREGYRIVSGGKGSHLKLKRAQSPMIIIPDNRTNLSPAVTRNTLKALNKDYGLPDLPSLLERS